METKRAFLCSLILFFFLYSAEMRGQDSLSSNLIIQYEFNGDGTNIVNTKYYLKIGDETKNYDFKWMPGRDGSERSALLFTGNSNGLKTSLNISPQILPELTYIAWVYDRPDGFLFGSTLPVNSEKKFSSRSLQFSKGTVIAGFNKLDTLKKPYFASLQTSKLKKDKWNFIALTVSSVDSVLRLYVNNEYFESKGVCYTPNNSFLIIGNTVNSPYTRPYRGRVDEIRVYNKALTAAEISLISGFSISNAQERLERNATLKKALIAGLIAFLFLSVVYMIVVLITERRYRPIKVSSFRSDSNKAPIDRKTEEANKLASDCVENAFETWETVSEEGGQVLKSPTKHKHFKTTYKALAEAKSYNPDDIDVINRMNELGNLLNKLSKRKFYGNWFLAILTLIFPIVYFLIERNHLDTKGMIGVGVMLLPALAYILSNFAHNYVVANRTNKVGGIFGKVIAFIMGAAASAVAVDYYTETTWSDGSKTTEYDTGSNAISLVIWVLLIIAAILLSMILAIIAAIIAFFRNYIFYI